MKQQRAPSFLLTSVLLLHLHGCTQRACTAQVLHQQAVPPEDSNSRGGAGDGDEAEEKGEASKRDDDIEIPIGVEVLCCAFSSDGEFFAVGASDGVVRVFNDTTRVRDRLAGNPINPVEGSKSGWAAVFQQNNQPVIDCFCRVWVRQGRVAGTVPRATVLGYGVRSHAERTEGPGTTGTRTNIADFVFSGTPHTRPRKT